MHTLTHSPTHPPTHPLTHSHSPTHLLIHTVEQHAETLAVLQRQGRAQDTGLDNLKTSLIKVQGAGTVKGLRLWLWLWLGWRVLVNVVCLVFFGLVCFFVCFTNFFTNCFIKRFFRFPPLNCFPVSMCFFAYACMIHVVQSSPSCPRCKKRVKRWPHRSVMVWSCSNPKNNILNSCVCVCVLCVFAVCHSWRTRAAKWWP